MPLEQIPTKCLTISSEIIGMTKFEEALRGFETPIITRLYKDKIFIDLRTVRDDEVQEIVNGILVALKI